MKCSVFLFSSETEPVNTEVKIVSYSIYCRYRAISRRCENVKEKFFKNVFVAACGGIMMKTRHGRIMFCRDTFNDPDLANLDICCEYLGKFFFLIFSLVSPSLNRIDISKYSSGLRYLIQCTCWFLVCIKN